MLDAFLIRVTHPTRLLLESPPSQAWTRGRRLQAGRHEVHRAVEAAGRVSDGLLAP